MSKFVGFIIGAITLTVGIVTGNVALIVAGAGQLLGAAVNLLLAPKAQKPQAAETQVKSPTAPRVYGYGTRRVRGSVVWWGNTPKGETVDVLAFVDGRANAIRQAYLNDEVITVTDGAVNPIGKKYGNQKVGVGWNLGETPAPVHTQVVAALPGIWTNDHRGDGVVSGYVYKIPEKEEDYLETYPQGDNVELSLVIDLQRCFDPRTGTTAWTENPVLHLLHYFVVRRGYDYNKKILPQVDKWIAAANVCDEIISGEKRYRSCVLYDSNAKPSEVIGSLIESFDGWYCENERGEIIVYAGKYYTPTVSIGPDQIVEYDHRIFVPEEDIYNEISVTYISSLHDYNEVEAQPWRDETDITNRGVVNSQGMNPQVPSFKQGRRLAKINMARQNTPDRGTIVTNYAGRIAEGHRFINLLIEEAGTTIFDGVAEVVKITRNLETHGLTIEWVRAEASAWSWNPVTEDGYGAALGSFPTVAAPTPPTISSVDYSFDNKAQTASIVINGTGPDRDDLTWYARIREQGTSAWEEKKYTDIAPGPAVALKIAVVPIDTPLEVQISFSTGNAKLSGWSDSFFAEADSNATPPDAAGTPTLLSWTSVLRMTVTPVPRATSYTWQIYESDGTTLVATRTSTSNTLDYTSSQASADGLRRSYVFKVAGVNSAGTGTYGTSALISNPAPAQVTGVSATTSNYIPTITFTASTAADLTGYAIYYSKTSGFDPATTGYAEIRGKATTQQLFSLGAGTYYFRVAALDGWTNNPTYLNLSTQSSFTINIGTESGIGGTGSGGGDGGVDGGGNYETSV